MSSPFAHVFIPIATKAAAPAEKVRPVVSARVCPDCGARFGLEKRSGGRRRCRACAFEHARKLSREGKKRRRAKG